MPIRKIEAGRLITSQSYDWVGPLGTIWYDEVLGDLRIGDGVTPGGRLLQLGGGGGGAGWNGVDTFGANGGSGIIILSIPTASYSGNTSGSPTVSTSGANTILQYTSSGTYTA